MTFNQNVQRSSIGNRFQPEVQDWGSFSTGSSADTTILEMSPDLGRNSSRGKRSISFFPFFENKENVATLLRTSANAIKNLWDQWQPGPML